MLEGRTSKVKHNSTIIFYKDTVGNNLYPEGVKVKAGRSVLQMKLQNTFYLSKEPTDRQEAKWEGVYNFKIQPTYFTPLKAPAPAVLLYHPSAPSASPQLQHVEIGWSNF